MIRTIASILFLCLLNSAFASNLSVSILHMQDGKRLFLDSLRYKNANDQAYSISRLSYLLTGFAFQTDDGEWVEVNDSVAWIDLAKQRTTFKLRGIPSKKFRAMRFNVGVDEIRNHSDPTQHSAQHPLNPNLNQLHWNWQGGYIFLALEGRYRESGGLEGFVYHLANDVNRTQIHLLQKIDLSKDATVEIAFDLGALLNSPEILSFSVDGASTHSHPGDTIATKLVSNLPGAFHIIRVSEQAALEDKPKAPPIDLPENWTAYRFAMGRSFPIPELPTDNPLIVERIELGEHLFFDPLLSKGETVSCASCHDPTHAFSDKRARSQGMADSFTRRHSMPLFNLAWKHSFFWDGRAKSLREQVLEPLQNPIEMGETLENIVLKLAHSEKYPGFFKKAFHSGEISADNLTLALEAYLLSLTSYNSKFDRAIKGQTQLSDLEKRGFELFMTEFEPRSKRFGADCFHCHGGALFTDHDFHNNGLAASDDRGLAEITNRKQDIGKFSTPSLRNVALTAPYMHDGRFGTLEEVIEHYNTGIQDSETLDPNLAKHPKGGLNLSNVDKTALVEFLKTLTDPRYQE